MNNFVDKYKVGKIAEQAIGNWYRKQRYCVLPIEKDDSNVREGPRLLLPSGRLIAPDLLVFNKDGEAFWAEVKCKGAFTWHRKTSQWVTGIDYRLYRDYLKILDFSSWPIWLLFLQQKGRAKDTPPGRECPTGLFGGDLQYLSENENHRWAYNMVYWSYTTLIFLAPLDEI